MAVCDSPVVQALVDRARSPIGVGDVRDEVTAALASSDLSPRDRARLLLADVVVSQGQIPAAEAAVRIELAVAALKETGDDDDARISAIAMSAAIHALIGDMEMCLERSLDLSALIRFDALDMFSLRSGINSGVALLSLGAYELAGSLFADCVARGIVEDEPMPILVGSINLALSMSREALVDPSTDIIGEGRSAWLNLLDEAMDAIDAVGPDGARKDHVNAVRSHVALLRGDPDGAADAWGDMDALGMDPTDSFSRYFCLLEAPIALHLCDLDRALALVDRSLHEATSRDLVPLRRVEALRLRSVIQEKMGNASEALADARQATELALQETSRLPDVLIGQINHRVLLEDSQRHLLDQATELTEQALVDELSQIGNRRAYEQVIDELRDGPARHVGVVVCDIDAFKAINDRYGHGVGDAVISHVGGLLSSVSRSNDRAFRYGGDEFVLVVPADSTRDAMHLAERLHGALGSMDWAQLGLAESATCSIGVSTGSSRSVDAVIAEADAQLYAAKRAGRNCIRPIASNT